MAISMTNRFHNIFVPFSLIFALAVMEQVSAAECSISQHKFNHGNITVNTVCEKKCNRQTSRADEGALCIRKYQGIDYVFKILTGTCSNGKCQDTNEGEIYKRELEEPLLDNYNPEERKPWPFECRFTNIQDKTGKVFLSTECAMNCSNRKVKPRGNGTPCVFSNTSIDEYTARIIIGVCDNGQCLEGKKHEIEVEKELVYS
uniref:Putative secreted protein n=1 Tax=Ixodes ricinus TaxID=34613 RepID=A0A0K8R4M5_IXORI